jgi:exosortase/archaeosortase family protein
MAAHHDSKKQRRQNLLARKGKGKRASWLSGRRPVIRFVLIFAGLGGAFNIFFYTILANSGLFRAYLRASAALSALMLRIVGTDAAADNAIISGGGFDMKITVGCDAIQPIALFCCAVLASPIPLRPKLAGIVFGTFAMLMLNLVRIMTLFLAGIHAPRFFDLLHVDIWQAAFIFVAMLLWVRWAMTANRPPVAVNRA